MGYHDGKSFFSLDFSLHGEKGKNQKKPYGLTASQAKERFGKKRGKSSKGIERTDEYGMSKMGKTRYDAFGKSLTSKEIVDLLRRKKNIRRSKLLGYYCAETIAVFKGIEVKLLFCKASKKGNWNGMMTTNAKLTFEEAYKIYSTRWTIEVFFKESKQHLGLGKCQAQDFDAQIAATTLCMLQYNLLSVVKRFNDYETFGELFREVRKDSLKITIAEQIWLIITEIIAELSEIFNIDTELLMEKLFSENEKVSKLLNLKKLSQTG